jgi:hypothetical protein
MTSWSHDTHLYAMLTSVRHQEIGIKSVLKCLPTALIPQLKGKSLRHKKTPLKMRTHVTDFSADFSSD